MTKKRPDDTFFTANNSVVKCQFVVHGILPTQRNDDHRAEGEVTEEHLLSHSKYHIVKTFLSDQHFLFCRGFYRHLIISIVEVYHQSNFIASRNCIASFILSSFFIASF